MRDSTVLVVALLLCCVSAAASDLVDPAALLFSRSPAPASAEWSKRTETHCLALNIYHEARGESLEGQLAVAAVTLNRVRSRKFPEQVCEVVWQRRQFSWTHDGKSDLPRNLKAWKSALRIANAILDIGHVNVVGGATHFHAAYVRTPYWTRKKQMIRRIGSHLFY